MKVLYFNNNSGGGVLTVINNLIKYQDDKNICNEIVYTIDYGNKTDFKKKSINPYNILASFVVYK